MNGVRVHVMDLFFRDRLLCGRLYTGQMRVGLMAAASYTNLCLKCRDRLAGAWGTLKLRAEPKPPWQMEFGFEANDDDGIGLVSS